MKRALARLGERTNGFTVTPGQYAIVAYLALGALTLIVLTGAAVRLTSSGLGCPEWPQCYGRFYPPLSAHAVIEFSNRVITGPVSIAAVGAWLLSYRRRPYRRDLMWLSLALPAGVLAQAVLGGLTVEGKLAYGWVMGHFAVSMLLLVAALSLAWRASHEPSERSRPQDRLLVWGTRALVALGALTIFAGTAATAAGPHAGGEHGQRISRLDFDGRGTMDFVIHRHAEIAIAFGLLAVALWWLAWERGAERQVRRSSTAVCLLLGVQGVVGAVQYESHLPAGLVWVHVALACLAWLATLWMGYAVAWPEGSRSPLQAVRERTALAGGSGGATLAPGAQHPAQGAKVEA